MQLSVDDNKKRRTLISPEEISRAKEVLKMLSDADNSWSQEKAQATIAFMRSLMNRFKRPDLQRVVDGGSDRHSEPNAAVKFRFVLFLYDNANNAVERYIPR